MTGRAREFAKFFSGIAAHETVAHWWLGIWGRDLLPFKLSWFTFTEELNFFAMTAWPIVLIALVYVAWVRPARVRTSSPDPAAA